jgi:hypothetical protein
LFIVARAMREKSLFTSGFVKNACAFGGGMLLPFGLTCLALACAGVFSRFWFWTFTYAHSYVRIESLREGMQHLAAYLQDTFDMALGFWTILILGLPLAFFDKGIRRQTSFGAGFGFFSFLGVAIGLYFRRHYFVLALPALAVLLGAAVVAMQRAMRFRIFVNVFKSLPLILFAMTLSWVIFYQAQAFFQLSPLRLCEFCYRWNPFEESIAAAGYIREHSAPDARVGVIGSEPEIYFYANRHSATGYIYTYALMEPQPDARAMQRDMILEIETNRPEYLVHVSYGLSWGLQPLNDQTILDWFKEYSGRDYEAVGLIRRNSAGKLESFWDDAAKAHLNDSGEYIAIFRRRPSDI